MSQSPAFDERLQLLKEGDPTAENIIQANGFHDDNAVAKKLVIAWHTGRRMFFHYAHLITCEFDLDKLVLEFMTRHLTLKGYHLDALFDSFQHDRPHLLSVIPERYAGIREPGQPFVTDAVVEK